MENHRLLPLNLPPNPLISFQSCALSAEEDEAMPLSNLCRGICYLVCLCQTVQFIISFCSINIPGQGERGEEEDQQSLMLIQLD